MLTSYKRLFAVPGGWNFSFAGFILRMPISMLYIAIVLFVVAITLAPPIQHYFTQRAQINSLKTQISDNQAMLDKAAAELAQWDDPEYVASQARA